MSQTGFFAFMPYLAVTVGLAGVVWRLAGSPGAGPPTKLFASRSWVWRIGITAVLAGHATAFLLPDLVLAWNRSPIRLVALEIVGMAFAGMALVGLIVHVRRRRSGAAEVGTSRIDTVVVTLLGLSIVSGLGIALLHRWGSSWTALTVVPYLRSVVQLDPEPYWIASLPFLVRLHVASFFTLVALSPFSSAGTLLARRNRRLDLALVEN